MNSWKTLVVVSIILNLVLAGGLFYVKKNLDTLKHELEIPFIPSPESISKNDLEISTSTINTDNSTATENASLETDSLDPNNFSKLFTLFSDLLSSIVPANTSDQNNVISIMDDPVADDVIYALAEDAGYLRQRVATTSLVVLEGYRVQPQVKENWIKLKESARVDGINLGIVSGFRSPEAQRSLFLKYFKEEAGRAKHKAFTAEEVKNGEADEVLIQTLTYTAPPGYSRHHTGYTIDIRDIDSGFSFYEFGKTRGFKWISRNNYEKAREFGFIPSYPKGERAGGPEPEPWELVWVGIYEIENLDWTRLQ